MKYLTNTIQKIAAIGLIALLGFSYGCTDNLSSVRDNPNEPSEASTTFLLTNAQKDLADNYYESELAGYFGLIYAQYWSQNQYTSESRYAFRASVVNDIWADYYTSLNDLQRIIEFNRQFPEEYAAFGNNANQIAVAKILQAWTYQTITDIWGAIPFEEDLGGSENPSPAYNTQEEVYTGIIRLLTEASDSISVNEPGFTSGDVFYGGDMAKWKKFANSLKMRAAMRIADVKPDQAETAVNEALEAGVMTSNDDNALFGYLAAVPNNNPINQAFKTRDDFRVSEPLVSTMESGVQDPRLPQYAAPVNGQSTYVGFPYGLAQAATTSALRASTSKPSEKVRAADFPAIFMLYDEVLFLQAEAAQRGFITGSAASFYEEAIRASMTFWDVTDQAAIDAYVADNPYNAGNWKQILGTQKWLAMYMQGIQGWAEWRRLDFENVLVPPVSGKLAVTFSAPIALRYPYPSDEKQLNGENANAAIENQGFSADDQGQKVWWDVN